MECWNNELTVKIGIQSKGGGNLFPPIFRYSNFPIFRFYYSSEETLNGRTDLS